MVLMYERKKIQDYILKRKVSVERYGHRQNMNFKKIQEVKS